MRDRFVYRLTLTIVVAIALGFALGLIASLFLKVSFFVAFALLSISSAIMALTIALALPSLLEPLQRLTIALKRGEEPSGLLLLELGTLGEAIAEACKTWHETVSQLKEERALLQTILRRMDEAIIVAQENGTVILANPAAQKFFQLPNDYAQRRLTELDLPFGLMELTQNALRYKLPQMGEVQIIHPEEKFLDAYATPLLINGQLEGVLVVARDLTKLKRLERIRKDFVANVSHELRTPIATLRSLAEALLIGGKDDPEIRENFLQAIADETERISRLLNNLLELARIEAGQREWHFQNVDVAEITGQIVDRFSLAASQKGLKIKAEIPEELKVRTDPDALMQVLFNLVDNAVKYTHQGEVIIRGERFTYTGGDWVVISVTDTGIGIPPEHLPRIFERFYRVEKARSRQSGGFGLGLSIAKHIIESIGGKITVQSQVGKGSTFSIWLPSSKLD
ncbi:MAG: ATP-binding protein [Armatimonadetes bacterium]|nr:ATP-binding protein [Armatimonadota bacterium]